MKQSGIQLRRYLYLATVLGGLGVVHPAFAQIPPDLTIPGSADPGRVLENQKPAPVPQQDLEAAPQPKKAVPQVPPGMENVKFTLKDLSVDHMTAYSPLEIAKYYQPYIGREITVAQLFQIMGAIQQKYLDDGYALTKVVIPNQNIKDGHVRFDVIEGHVGDVEIGEDIPPSPVIDDAVRQIKDMRPLNVKKLERIMLIVNDLPDLNVSAVLANPVDPKGVEPGTVRLIFKKNPNDEKVASISVDDYGSVFTGPWEGKANARLFNLGPNYSEFNFSALGTAPLSEQRLISGSYSLPLFGVSGTKLTLSASNAWTQPGSSLKELEIKGNSQSLDANISYPVIRQRDMTLTIDGGYEWKNARTKVLGEELYDDRLRIVKTGLNFNFTDRWAGYNVMDVHYSHGLNIMGARESGSDNLSRQFGKSDFSKFEFVAGRLQALPANFEIFALLNAQYTRDPLLSSEEFGFGGGQVGRGYDPSEITGDKGVSASLELRYRTTLNAFKTTFAVQPYIFYDIGKVWNIDPGAKDELSAASTGAGLRVDLGNDWNMDFNLATPLTKSADHEPGYENDLGARALFSLTRNF